MCNKSLSVSEKSSYKMIIIEHIRITVTIDEDMKASVIIKETSQISRGELEIFIKEQSLQLFCSIAIGIKRLRLLSCQ